MATFETRKFYRGVSLRHPLDKATIIRPRKDRRPRNTSSELHKIADKWFLDNFGISYRSQAIFATPQFYVAQGYAASPEHVVRIIPLSEYNFCWSTKISDMLMLCMAPSARETITQRLIAADYKDTDLSAAHESGNEIMIQCDSYISIPIGLLNEDIPPKNISCIILP